MSKVTKRLINDEINNYGWKHKIVSDANEIFPTWCAADQLNIRYVNKLDDASLNGGQNKLSMSILLCSCPEELVCLGLGRPVVNGPSPGCVL